MGKVDGVTITEPIEGGVVEVTCSGESWGGIVNEVVWAQSEATEVDALLKFQAQIEGQLPEEYWEEVEDEHSIRFDAASWDPLNVVFESY